MLAFGLTYGVNAGLLSREEYLPVIDRAREVVKRMQRKSGGVGYCQPGGDRPCKFERESNIREPADLCCLVLNC